MNKKMIIWGAVGALVLLGIYFYNSLVTLEETTVGTWADVEVQYQRRADLIPNLVNTVKGYASHEKEVLLGITEARSKVGSIKLDATNLTKENLAVFQQAQSGLSSALSRLMMVSERYPELRANDNFLQLMGQLEGTENRIAVARKRYNDGVVSYNSTIRKFPYVIFASIFGFDRKAVFEADAGTEKAPTVSFE